MIILRTYANNLSGSLDSVRELGIYARDESVSLTRLYHHHAEVVALEHLIVGLFEVVTLTATFLGQQLCITLTTLTLVVMTQVDNLYAFKRQFQFCGLLLYHLVITEKDRIAQALIICIHGSLDHGRMQTFCKHHPLRMLAGCFEELLGERSLLSHAQTQFLLVFCPVSNRLAGYTAVHSGLGNS